MKRTILDWFDITNPEHLRAYRYLEKHGTWPEGFLPSGDEDMAFPAGWQLHLAMVMASAYVDLKIAEADREARTEHFDMKDPAQFEVAMGRIFDIVGLKK